MKIFFMVLVITSVLWSQTTINIDASVYSGHVYEKKFDFFVPANIPASNRLSDAGSKLVRVVVPIDGGGFYSPIVTKNGQNLEYDFTWVDNFISQIVASGADIMLCYAFLPPALAPTNTSAPSNNADWTEFNRVWANHFWTEFGITSFEIYNEPDWEFFFTENFNDYTELFKYAHDGIMQSTVPSPKIGGLSLANSISWVGPFLDYVNNNNLQLDYVTYHAQNNTVGDFGTKYHVRYLSIVDQINQRNMDIDIYLNEFSYDINPSPGDIYTRVECANWFFDTFKFVSESCPKLTKFHKTIVDNGNFAPQWAYNGLIREDGIPRAKYNAFLMFSMMADDGLQTTVDNSNVGCIATINDDKLTVAVWNRTNFNQTININIDNVNQSVIYKDVYLIDRNNSSYEDNQSNYELQNIESSPYSNSEYQENINLGPYAITMYDFKLFGDNPLPVTLSNNEAIVMNDYVLITWTSESEYNNLGYELFRENDNKLIDSYKTNSDLVGSNKNYSTQYSTVDYDIYPDAAYYLISYSYNGEQIVHDTFYAGGTTGIKTVQNKFSFDAYPNPFNSSFVVGIHSHKINRASVSVYNVFGQVVHTQNIVILTGPNYYNIDMDYFSSGVYIVKFSTENEIITKKLTLVK